jgi:uncharacterized membrane protein YhaH (DUF805 family)
MVDNFFLYLIDPKRPVGRRYFMVVYGLGLFLAANLYPRGQPYVEGRRFVFVLLYLTAVFGFMGLTAARRLLDIGWSRCWALLGIGPPLLQIVAEQRSLRQLAHSGRLHGSFALLDALVLALYIVGAIVLALQPGRRRN